MCVYTHIHWVNSDKSLNLSGLLFTIPSNKRISFYAKEIRNAIDGILAHWKVISRRKSAIDMHPLFTDLLIHSTNEGPAMDQVLLRFRDYICE